MHDIADVEAYTRRVLDRTLAQHRQHLEPYRYEDAHQELIAAAWELSLRWQPERGIPFSHYAGRLLAHRFTDWQRRSTGRHAVRVELVSLDRPQQDELVDTQPDRSPDLLRAIRKGARLDPPPETVADHPATGQAA